MRWTAEEILEANPAQLGQSRSILERVLLSPQANLDVLAEVADEIERRSVNHVAALFQLPYPVRLAEGWHRVPTATDGMTYELSCDVCGITMPTPDEYRLERQDDAYGIASLSEAPVPNRVHAYMAMTAPGRINFAGESVSIVRALIEGLAAKPAPNIVSDEHLSVALRTR